MDEDIFRWMGIERIADSDIEQLVKHVRAEPKRGRQALKDDLEDIRVGECLFSGPYPTRTELGRHAKSVEATTRRLLELIDPDAPDNPWRHITGKFSSWGLEEWSADDNTKRPSLRVLREGLQELLATAQMLVEPFKPSGLLAELLSPSRFETLIGRLAQVFERNFGSKAGSARRAKDQQPDSPFIRFADFTLKNIMIHNEGEWEAYSTEYIIRTLTKVRTAEGKRISPP
jgi:hypothetical protein